MRGPSSTEAPLPSRAKTFTIRDRWHRRWDEGSRNETGFVMPMFGIMLTALMGAAGFGIDLGNWYLQAQRLQRGADAAALAGSTYLPNDFPTAKNLAITSLKGNDLDPASASISQSTQYPTQLSVKVTKVVPNYVLNALGMKNVTINRSATGEYRPFVPMGSPSNVLGAEPGTDDWETTGTSNQYWLNMFGGGSTKSSGDRWSGGVCGNSTDRCSTAAAAPYGNSDYSTDGQIYVVRVKPGATGPLVIQAFDPGLTDVDDHCTSGYLDGAPATSDNRYGKTDTNPYCSGDKLYGTGTGKPTATTFEVWTPAESPGGSKPISTNTCKAQTFPGFSGAIGPKLSSDPAFKASFRQWVSLCSIYIGAGNPAGDYLLHVNTSLYDSGANRFALRVGIMGSDGKVNKTASKQVSVFSKGRLVIYALNQASEVTFYLARIQSGAAGHNMSVTLFDIGDANQPVSMALLPPSDAKVNGTKITKFNSCTYTPPSSSTYRATNSNCGIDGMTSSTFDGKLVNINVPIPDEYTCEDANPDACWTRIKVTYSGSGVQDTTSWEVGLDGQPVHLVVG